MFVLKLSGIQNILKALLILFPNYLLINNVPTNIGKLANIYYTHIFIIGHKKDL